MHNPILAHEINLERPAFSAIWTKRARSVSLRVPTPVAINDSIRLQEYKRERYMLGRVTEYIHETHTATVVVTGHISGMTRYGR